MCVAISPHLVYCDMSPVHNAPCLPAVLSSRRDAHAHVRHCSAVKTRSEELHLKYSRPLDATRTRHKALLRDTNLQTKSDTSRSSSGGQVVTHSGGRQLLGWPILLSLAVALGCFQHFRPNTVQLHVNDKSLTPVGSAHAKTSYLKHPDRYL